MKVAYVVSRFPLASETFILRELNALDGRDGIELELFSLFPAGRPYVHPEAHRWLARVRRTNGLGALRGLAFWLRRRPGAVGRALADLVARAARRPPLLARSLVAFALAAEHARAVRTTGVEHVHAHFATYPALAAWVCHRLAGCSYSITAHAHDLFVDQTLLPLVVPEAAFVAAISEFNQAFLARHAGRRVLPPVHLVRCGVDPSAYRFRPRRPPAEGPVSALCVASLQEYKGHQVLLEALALGGGDLGRMQLDLVGTGPLEETLRQRAEELGLVGRVHFLGNRSEPEVSELLDRADVFVLPSVVASDGQMEGVPVALMEALAAGVPVVSTRLSGIPELVRDGETGLLAEPGDPASLADALGRALAEPEAAAVRGQAGRELVEREFAIERSADRLAALFADVVAGRAWS